MTPIMQLWARIAAGKLPEGIGVDFKNGDSPSATILINGCRHTYLDDDSTNDWHRYALLKIVDAWETQGLEFSRRRYGRSIAWGYYDGDEAWWGNSNESEILALATVLAEGLYS